ncbi:MAG TPA: hypothetical protein VJQ45_02810 [Ktedonobacterales bacterium]|nr:hypothetical protein [Ktedonobacterales bacterium]
MRERISSLMPFIRRWGWVCIGLALALALVLTGALALAAAGSGRSGHPSAVLGTGTPSIAAHSAPSTTTRPGSSATATPTHPASAIATPARTATSTTGPNASRALTCTVHVSAGDSGGDGGDDSVTMALACTVAHAPQSDTSFSLSFGVLDPLGQAHTFTQACAGALRGGSGSCSQSYTFVVPYGVVPAPVTGQSLPSRQQLGPTTPTAV